MAKKISPQMIELARKMAAKRKKSPFAKKGFGPQESKAGEKAEDPRLQKREGAKGEAAESKFGKKR